MKDKHYEGYFYIDIIQFIESNANELYGVGFRQTFHSKEMLLLNRFIVV